jgi:hypothetical protein
LRKKEVEVFESQFLLERKTSIRFCLPHKKILSGWSRRSVSHQAFHYDNLRTNDEAFRFLKKLVRAAENSPKGMKTTAEAIRMDTWMGSRK